MFAKVYAKIEVNTFNYFVKSSFLNSRKQPVKKSDLFTFSVSCAKKLLTFSYLILFTAFSVSEPLPSPELEQAKNAFFSGNMDRANVLFSQITNSHEAEAYYYLALIEKRSANESGNYASMIDYLRMSASEGNSLAMWEMGEAYQNGHGVEADPIRAMDWYRKSESNLGRETRFISFQSINNGQLEEQSKAEMVERIHETASAGDVDAQYQLAKIYDNGLFAKRDSSKAFRWYQKAAKNGHRQAGFSLAYFYCRGIGTEQNVTQANYWLMESGHPGECKNSEGAGK